MTVPSKKLFTLSFIVTLFSLSVFIKQSMLEYCLGIDCLLLLLVIADRYFSPKRRYIILSCNHVPPFSIAKKNDLIFTASNKNRRDLQIELRIDLPDFWEEIDSDKKFLLKTDQNNEIIKSYIPKRRAIYKIKNIYYRFSSPFGFFHLHEKKQVDLQVEVFPDIKTAAKMMQRYQKNCSFLLGTKRNQLNGGGTEIEYLREYNMDDDSKNIDWKVSTRINKLVSKAFQLETNNHITIAFDCGRLMTAEHGGLSSLDYAINAALAISKIAHKMNDSINMLAFSDRIINNLATVKGKNSLGKITRFMTKLQPDYIEPNYPLVFDWIRTRIKRRSLIILFTDIIDDINYTYFKKHFHLLTKRHIVMVVLVRDSKLQECAEKQPTSTDDLYQSAAAADMYLRRKEVTRKLQHMNINVLDLLPNSTTPGVIDKYLELKMKNYL